jgi:hypothetical protein
MKPITLKGIIGRLVVTLALLVLICPVLGGIVLAGEAQAVTTANITITVTPGAIAISVNATTYDFGTVITSGTAQTDTSYFGIDNTSTVVTNHSIAVLNNTWTGGATAWTHSDNATAGADTVGLSSNKGGTWGVSDIIVKYATPNNIATSQAATTDYSFGLKIYLPTSTTVTDEKTNTVQVTVSAA